jgi:hypothetical protein
MASFALRAHAIGEAAQTFTVDARLYSDVAATTPLLDASTLLKVQILTQDQTCILYEESQTVNTVGSDGYFTIQVGSVTGAAKRGGNDSGNAMATVFSNTAVGVPGKLISNSSGCSYSAAAGDERFIRVQVTPSSDGITRLLTPNMALDSVPSALVAERAESVQGLLPNQLLQVGTGDLTQLNLQSVFATGNATKLNTLLSIPPANYLRVDSNNGTMPLPTLSAPTAPSAGELWYDSGVLKFYDGSNIQTLGVSGAGITSLGVGTGLTPAGTISASGTTLAVDVGTAVGQIVQVAAGGKLPTLDGSNLTNLNGTAMHSGTIGGSTAIATSGNIQTSNDVTAKRLFAQDSGVNYVGLQAPTTVTNTYSLTLPSAQGSANTILLNDGAGNLSWVSQSTGSLTSLIGTGPINITGTASVPIVGITKADTTHDGYLALADWNTFNGKLSTALASAKIWVGGAGGVAAPQTPSGDVSLTNAGAFTVTGVIGKTVSAVPTTSGQVLRYDGASWTPNFVAMTDLRSTVTGTNQFASSCTSSQTLTYNSVGDVMSCQNITIGASNFSAQATNTFLAAPNGSTGAPTFRTIASADLPSGIATAGTYTAVTVDTYGRVTAGTNPTTLSGFGITDAIKNGGQTGAVTAGPSDANSLTLQTSGSSRVTISTAGNVGIATSSPNTTLDLNGALSVRGMATAPAISPAGQGRIYFDSATNTFQVSQNNAAFTPLATVGAAQTFTSDITMSGSGTGLNVTTNETVGGTLGVSGLTTLSGGATVAANQALSMASGTGQFSQTYSGTSTAHTITGTVSGNLMDLTSTSNAAVSGDRALNIAVSGVNPSSVTRYGVYSDVVATGPSSTNVGGYFSASGASNNYGLIVANGNVGIGTTTPSVALDVNGGIRPGSSTVVTTCNATTEGTQRYNYTTHGVEFCNGTSWTIMQVGTCSQYSPTFSFNNLTNQSTSTLVTSNIIQITGLNCVVPVQISGAGSPMFRICQDAACATVIQSWTSSPASIQVNQYLQVEQTTPAAGGASYSANVIIGGGASVWSAGTTGSCAGLPSTPPPIGTVCADGTVYAGTSPDGGVPMFTTRCDYNLSWNGVTCAGSALTLAWDNYTGTYTATSKTSAVTGQANTIALAGFTTGGGYADAPYTAAQDCNSMSTSGITQGSGNWYLPSKNELAVLYTNATSIGNFTTNNYWSSSEYNNSYAWTQTFSTGIQTNYGKFNAYYVRCVRR